MEYYETILDNGLKIKLCPMPHTHTVTIILQIRLGAAYEPLSKKGITHLVEHMCFRRCDNIPQDEFYYNIEKIGGFLRGVTFREHVIFEITINKKYIREATNIIRKLINENKWIHDDLRCEKKVVYRQINDSSWGSYKRMILNFFEEKAAGEPLIGTANKIKHITLKELQVWKSELFIPNNALLIIVGDIDEEDINYTKELFADIHPGAEKYFLSIIPDSFLQRSPLNDMAYTSSRDYIDVSLSFDVDKERVTFPELYFLKTLMADGLVTPLKSRLREQLGLVSEIDSDAEQFKFGSLLYFIFTIPKSNIMLFMNEITNILCTQKNTLHLRAFECTKVCLSETSEGLLDDPREYAYQMIAHKDCITTPESYLKIYSGITYERMCEVVNIVFNSPNLIITINNANDDMLDMLYTKKEILRNKLGE